MRLVGIQRIGQIIVGAGSRSVVEWCSGQIRGTMGYWLGPGLALLQSEMGEDLADQVLAFDDSNHTHSPEARRTGQ
jgi:hypothetical protein